MFAHMLSEGQGLTSPQLLGFPSPQAWQTGPSPLVFAAMPLPPDAPNLYLNTNLPSMSAYHDTEGPVLDLANLQTTMTIPTTPSHSSLGLWASPLLVANSTLPPNEQVAFPSGSQALASPLLFPPGIQVYHCGSPLSPSQRDDGMNVETGLPTPDAALPNTLGLQNVLPATNPRGLPTITVEEALTPAAPLLGTVPLPADVAHPPNVSFRRVYHRSFGRNEH